MEKAEMIQAIETGNAWFEEVLEQIESVKENISTSLTDIDEVLDVCVFLDYRELRELIEQAPEEYHKIIADMQ